jgi:hypothetical protein
MDYQYRFILILELISVKIDQKKYRFNCTFSDLTLTKSREVIFTKIAILD